MRRPVFHPISGIVAMLCACFFINVVGLQAEESAAVSSPGTPVQVGVVKEVEGSLEIKREGQALTGNAGDPIYIGDQLATGKTDRALIEFSSDKSLVKITYDSVLLLTGQEEKGNDQARIALIRGLMWGKKTQHESDLRIKTPAALLAVRGTEYFVKVLAPDMTEVVVKQGTVDISYEGYNVRASDMSRVTIQKGKAPRVQGITEKLLNEQWAQRFA